MSVNLVRQVIDIQSQIKNLNPDFTADQLRVKLNYNAEIKKSLLENITDDFTLKHIIEIPDFQLKNFKKGFDYIGFVVSVFSSCFDSFNDEKYDFAKAKAGLKQIENKYASLEQMLKY